MSCKYGISLFLVLVVVILLLLIQFVNQNAFNIHKRQKICDNMKWKNKAEQSNNAKEREKRERNEAPAGEDKKNKIIVSGSLSSTQRVHNLLSLFAIFFPHLVFVECSTSTRYSSVKLSDLRLILNFFFGFTTTHHRISYNKNSITSLLSFPYR